MNPQRQPEFQWQSEFDDLMQRLLDDQLSAADAARLDRILAANGEAIDAYLRLMTLDTVVRECAKSNFLFADEGAVIPDSVAIPDCADAEVYVCQDAAAVSPSPLMGEGSASSPSPLTGEGRGEGLPSAHSLPPPASKSPVLGFLSGVVDYVSNSPKLMFWLICTGFVAYFSIHFGTLLIERFWGQNAPMAAVGGTPRVAADDQPALIPGRMVARLTKAIDCNWRLAPRGQNANGRTDFKPVALAIDTQFAAGQRLDLSAGLAELTFASGAQVILHAPATFTVTDSLGGDLQLGKLVAKVSHDAKAPTAARFTINTPAGKVVDLGTEFGLKVADDRTMHVIVYVGQVEVESESGTAANSSGGAAQAPVTVKAGEAIVIGPGQPIKHVAPQDERFVRDLAPLEHNAGSEAAYVEFMKQLKPVVWYRMEGKETDRALHDEMAGQDAKLTWDGPGNPFTKGAMGKGLWLRDEPIKDGGAIVSDYPKADHDKLSVCAWVFVDDIPTEHDKTLVCNWDDSREPSGQFYFGLFKRWPKVVLGVVVQPREGKTAQIEEDLDHAFPVRQWQHVAFVQDGKSLHLYRQGREVPYYTHSCAGVRSPVQIKALAIGARLNAAGDAASAAHSDRWSGKLDEIAVFNDALSAETIRKLAAFGP